MKKLKTKTKSAKPSNLSMDDILTSLIELSEMKQRRIAVKSQITKTRTSLEYTKIDRIQKQSFMRDLETQEKILKQTEIKRFEKFVDLIVRIRNIDSVTNSYHKGHFISEIKTYFKHKRIELD